MRSLSKQWRANVADSAVLADLLHGGETRVWGDQAYRGQTEVIRECAPQAQNCTHRRYATRLALTKWNGRRTGPSRRTAPRWSTCFAVMKLKFGFMKLRYRGLNKNALQLFAVCVLVNLHLLWKKLLLLALA
jgi:IS5 family transposase